MSARRITFRDEMVRALLAGTKTQTRRVVKPQPLDEPELVGPLPTGVWLNCATERRRDDALRCPYGGPGDLLYVREAWRAAGWKCPNGYKGGFTIEPAICYRADNLTRMLSRPCSPMPMNGGWLDHRWRPSIHMRRWASRLTLRITEVRVERVAEISALDAQAEGVTHSGFRTLWDSMSAGTQFAWERNPWVWVICFDVIRKNVDDVLNAASIRQVVGSPEATR